MLRRTIRLNGWRILPLTEDISHRATMYVEGYALSDGLRVAGALIAASAVQSDSALITANTRHYKCIPDIVLERYRPQLAARARRSSRQRCPEINQAICVAIHFTSPITSTPSGQGTSGHSG